MKEFGLEELEEIRKQFVDPEERASLFSRFWQTGNAPRTKEELRLYFKLVNGFEIADRSVCEGHQSPLEFLWNAFTSDGLLTEFALAAKDTGKTQALSLLHHLNSRLKPRCWTAHMGAQQVQANYAYEYLQREVRKPWATLEVESSIQSRTQFKNGSLVQVMPGTIAAASGPHENVGVIDELELLDYDVFTHFSKTPHEQHGIPAMMILASTRFKKEGTVTRLMKELGPAMRTTQWCILEGMKTCKHQCDKPPVPEALTIQSGPHKGYCPLYSRTIIGDGGAEEEELLCGLGKKPNGKPHGKAHYANGHITYSTVLGMYLRSDALSFGTYQLLKEPGSEGMFFPMFQDVAHVKSEYMYVPGRPVYLGFDYGFADTGASCLGAWQVREDGVIYQFWELYVNLHTVPDMAAKVVELPWLRDVEIGWPDPSAQGEIEEWRRFFTKVLGRPVMVFGADNDRKAGWSVMRRRLRTPLGRALVGWHPDCKNTVGDIKGLATLEGSGGLDCMKKQDHGADQSRYLLRNIEIHLGVQEAWERDERPDDANAANQRAIDLQVELTVKERWDKLIAVGVTVDVLKEVELRFKGTERRAFARALGGWLFDMSDSGRIARTGVAPAYDDDPEDNNDEDN